MKELTVGTTYYVPESHHLVQVRGIEGYLVMTSYGCTYCSDARTNIGANVCPTTETQSWVPVLDPSLHTFLEKDELGWRVIEETLINKTAVQETLQKVVTGLKNIDDLQDVYLFGSVARDGVGHDIDIIATVSDKLFYKWTSSILTVIQSLDGAEDDSLYFNADLRMSCAADLLGIDPEDFEFYFENVIGVRGYPISFSFVYTDIFLFPHNWKERLEELQNMLPHSDPEFMYKIAKDAKLL